MYPILAIKEKQHMRIERITFLLTEMIPKELDHEKMKDMVFDMARKDSSFYVIDELLLVEILYKRFFSKLHKETFIWESDWEKGDILVSDKGEEYLIIRQDTSSFSKKYALLRLKTATFSHIALSLKELKDMLLEEKNNLDLQTRLILVSLKKDNKIKSS